MKRGFTLVELLVVITVVGVLSAIGLTTYSTARAKARDTTRQMDLANIQTALEQYYADQGFYPQTLLAGGELSFGTRIYMAKIPADPVNNTELNYTYTASPANCVINDPDNLCADYTLTAKAETKQGRTFTGTGNNLISLASATPIPTIAPTATPTPAPSCNPNLIAYWTMDGNANDSSGNGNNGTWSGTPSYTTGQYGNAAQFDGSSYINFGNPAALNLAGAFTITAWVKMNTVPSGNYSTFLAKMNGSTTHGYRFFYPGSARKLALDGYNDPIPYNGIASDVVTPDNNAWHFIAVTSNGEFYLDANNVGTRSYVVTDLTSTANFTIGSGVGLDNMIGFIDDVRIYNTAFNQVQLSNIMGGAGCSLP